MATAPRFEGGPMPQRSVPVVRVVQHGADGGPRLALAREANCPRYIRCAHDAAELARLLLQDRDRETFLAIHMDAKRRLLSTEVVAVGTLSAVLVHPREVFKGALLANAASIVVAHNHPSGDPTPSSEDLALTTQLMRAGEIVGVELTDHLILGTTTVSLRETTTLWR